MKIAASYLSSIFDKKTTINLLDKSNADYIHVDLMDGKFVENNNFEVNKVISDLQNTTKPLDIHLMTYEPEKYIDELASLNPKSIVFHLESNTDINKTIKLIKSRGIQVGIAIKPDTDIKSLNNYLSAIDIVLVMTVEPGAGGQSFMFDMLDKVNKLNKIKSNYSFKVCVDGGVNDNTILACKEAGADIVVCGSYICHHDNFNRQIDMLKKIA